MQKQNVRVAGSQMPISCHVPTTAAASRTSWHILLLSHPHTSIYPSLLPGATYTYTFVGNGQRLRAPSYSDYIHTHYSGMQWVNGLVQDVSCWKKSPVLTPEHVPHMPQEAAHADTLMSASVYPVAPVLAHLYILRLKNPQNYPTISAAIAAIVVFVL